MNALLRNRFRQVWRLISIATIISELFFFALFFSYFVLGYQLVISEPNLSTAITELLLTASALAYFVSTSLKLQASIILRKYAWLSVAVMQYLDFLVSALDISLVKGHEANPFFSNLFSPYSILAKLILIPGICLYIQLRFNEPRNLKWKSITGSIMFLSYIAVVVWNIIPLVI